MKKGQGRKYNRYLNTAIMILTAILLMSCGNAQKKEYSWPDTEIANQIPEPVSGKGEIVLNQEETLIANINETDEAGYKDYVEKCGKEGFTEQVSESEDVFTAENNEGYFLSIFYIADSNQMQITVNTPVDESSAAAEASLKNAQLSEAGISGSSQSSASSTAYDDNEDIDVKETLDEYETYINEYADFMKKNSTEDLSGDKKDEYMQYLSSLSEYMEKVSKIDQQYDTLSDEDKAYYDDVMKRIEETLREIGK